MDLSNIKIKVDKISIKESIDYEFVIKYSNREKEIFYMILCKFETLTLDHIMKDFVK